MRAFVHHDNVLFAGGRGGLFQSTNLGTTWEKKQTSPHFSSISDLAENSIGLLVATGSLYLSTDQGNTFKRINQNFYNVHGVFAFDSTIYMRSTSGMYRSDDSGSTWDLLTDLPSGTFVTSMSKEFNTLYAGTSGEGVWRSTDFGKSWDPVNSGLDDLDVNAVLFHDELVYAGTNTGIYYQNTDVIGPLVWVEWNENTDVNIRHFTKDETSSQTFALARGGEVYKLTNGVNEWGQVGQVPESDDDIISFSEYLLIAGDKGIFRSVNNGVTWNSANSGLNATTINTVYSNNSKLRIYTGSSNFDGFYTSTSGAYEKPDWQPMETGGPEWLTKPTIYDITGDDTTLFAAKKSGIYKSSDYGESWEEISDCGSNICWNIFKDGSHLYASQNSGKWLKSEDNGENWTPREIDAINSRIFGFEKLGPYLFAGANDGIFRSMDDGDTWEEVETGFENKSFISFAKHQNVLFAANHWEVYQSKDSGSTWTKVENGLPSEGVSTFFSEKNQLFAAMNGHGVWRSMDMGQSWDRVGEPSIDTTFDVNSLDLYRTQLLAGLAGGGVWIYDFPLDTIQLISPVNGFEADQNSVMFTWKPSSFTPASYRVEWSKDSNFTASRSGRKFDDTVTSFTQSLDNGTYYWRIKNMLYPDTTYSEVRKFTLGPPSGLNPAKLTSSRVLLRLAPSLVHFHMPGNGNAKISLHHISGKKVKQLANQHYPAGQHTVSLPSDLKPGVYWIRLRSSHGDVGRKFYHLR